MMYLKFCGTRSEQPIFEMMVACRSYSLARDSDQGVRVYHSQSNMETEGSIPPDGYEVVAADGWLNCFVMSETGKTIDKIEAS